MFIFFHLVQMQLRAAQERLKQTQTQSAKAKTDLDEMTIENEVNRTRARVYPELTTNLRVVDKN